MPRALRPRSRRVAPVPRFRFDGKNKDAQRAAAREAARMVTVVSNETKQAIRTLIVRSIQEGIAPYDAARMIRPMIGMTVPQANAALNYRQQLMSMGLSPARIDSAMQRYVAKKINERSITIARTEIMGALNKGANVAMIQSQRRGFLGPDAKKEWIVTPDDRLCPLCAPMDGVKVPIRASFSLAGPPAHPRCRCTITAVPGSQPTTVRVDPRSAVDEAHIEAYEINRRLTQARLQAKADARLAEMARQRAAVQAERAAESARRAEAARMAANESTLQAFRESQRLAAERATAAEAAEGAQAALRASIRTPSRPWDELSVQERAGYFVETASQKGAFMIEGPGGLKYRFEGTESIAAIRQAIKDELKLDPDDLFRGMSSVYSNIVPKGTIRIQRTGNGVELSLSGDGVTMTRTFTRHRMNDFEVHHDYFVLREKGGGRGALMVRDSLELYERLGVNYVTTFANIDVGGYAWGRLGFNAAQPEMFVRHMTSRLTEMARDGKITSSRATEIINGMRMGLFEEAPGYLTSLPEGKDILLGSNWNAILNIGDERYFRVRDRLIAKTKKKKP